MDVGVWLRSLGLAQYEAAFRENEIDGVVLPKLTSEDLRELGVAAIGHRRKIISAIEELDLSSAGSVTREPVVASISPRVSSPDAAERRQLTVMFCDLVGSTAMSAQLDPEDMREVIRAYQDACSGAVARYDGFVAKFMGDGVLAYFGFPRAHEDDAERAARAGLDIVAAAANLETAAKEKLQVRIGIATGIVVVGDLVGHGSAQEHAVVGDTPNLAARLQGLAEPGSIVIAETTRRLLGGTFELKPLGSQTLKGFDVPVYAWSVLREAESLSRFEASRSAGMTPFVGREHEVALLQDRWRDASEGEGQVVLLSGEAGIGKSRILAALRDKIGGEPHVTMRYQCSPHHVNDAFYPITSQILYAAGFVGGEPAAARLDKLEAMIGRSRLDTREIARFLAALLSIPFEGRYPPLEMAPSEQKERTITALIALFSGLTQEAPVLALLEDAHWIDPTALDLFGRLVDRLSDLRALLVLTFRPEFTVPWVGRANVTLLSLNRFGRRQAVAMIDQVTGGKALPAEVLEQIVAKTDGVPLFVEELTKTVLESGLMREEDGGFVLDRALTPLAIPSTLQDSLMARFDRLAPVKETAQIGAAIGREFSYRLLEAVSPIKGAALQDALAKLIAADLVHARGAPPPEATYIFKHALVQDTAYATLLRSRRQRIHSDIARALVAQSEEKTELTPAAIAHHFAEAGLSDEASSFYLDAGKLAILRSAMTEAREYLLRGVALVDHLPIGMNRDLREAEFCLCLGNVEMTIGGFASPEAEIAFARTTTICRLYDGPSATVERLLAHSLFGEWSFKLHVGRLMQARTLVEEFLTLSLGRGRVEHSLMARAVVGTNHFYLGDFPSALRELSMAMELLEHSPPITSKAEFGIDMECLIRTHLACVLACTEGQNAALHHTQIAIRRAEDLQHAPTLAMTLATAADVFWLMDRRDQLRSLLPKLTEISSRHGFPFWLARATCFMGWCIAQEGKPDDGVALIQSGLHGLREARILLYRPAILIMLAEAQTLRGHLVEKSEALAEVIAIVADTGERWCLSKLSREDRSAS